LERTQNRDPFLGSGCYLNLDGGNAWKMLWMVISQMMKYRTHQ
jgi:hypothetical protein